jgi:hypothetical protein
MPVFEGIFYWYNMLSIAGGKEFKKHKQKTCRDEKYHQKAQMDFHLKGPGNISGKHFFNLESIRLSITKTGKM